MDDVNSGFPHNVLNRGGKEADTAAVERAKIWQEYCEKRLAYEDAAAERAKASWRLDEARSQETRARNALAAVKAKLDKALEVRDG